MLDRSRTKFFARVRLSVIFSCAFVFSACACEREHKTLVSKEGCESPEIVRCLQDYAYEELTSEDIRKLSEEGLPKCFSEKDVFELFTRRLGPGCFGINVGTDKRLGPILVTYRCGEVCRPGGAKAMLMYASRLDLNTCCSKGGFESSGWGFGGCRPPESVPEATLPYTLCTKQTSPVPTTTDP